MHQTDRRRSDRRSTRPAPPLLALLLVAGALPLAAPRGAAQMPGIPVLQNAFTAPGVVAAANYGSGDDASTLALAASWTPGSARFVVSGGAGLYRPEEGDDVSAWGARLAAPLPRPSLGNLGVGLFVGVGGASPETGSVLQIPAGVSVGWRRALGATRAFSLYAAPFYNWTRVTVNDEKESAGHVRVSAGLDFALTPSIGLTVGVETGQEADDDEPGPTGLGWGLGLSYAFGRGR